ncbi:MAG TPA: MBOAT family O-acyltransferase [Ignavibacteria bacterium]
MLFNSIEFAIFFPTVFILYWFITNRNLQAQNLLLLFASYFFYGWWDWRFLLLLISISIINYFVGIRIDKNEAGRIRNMWLIVAILLNIGNLCIFKYYNFFIDSFINLISLSGYDLPRSTTRIILPLGISFYTFLSLSYILDIYKKNLSSHKNFIEVLLSLSFFPIILAGPIQRPASLLPQIARRREFEYSKSVDGLKQILWGLFTKIAIADNLAPHVDDIFMNYSDYTGNTLVLGAVFYAIQIYCDFSGYSNIAIGTGKLLGFNLMKNFAYPYFAQDISEFWKRWHISLTAWFRDYVFLPLSFTLSWKISKDKVLFIKTDLFIYIVASLVTWFLTGLWHGSNYTFIVWGMIHGFFLIIYQWQKQPRKRLFKKYGIRNNNYFVVIIETIITLLILILTWIFFRAESITHALSFLKMIFTEFSFSIPPIVANNKKLILLVVLFIFFEWIQRNDEYALQLNGIKYSFIRKIAYYTVIVLTIIFSGNKETFIYLQF